MEKSTKGWVYFLVVDGVVKVENNNRQPHIVSGQTLLGAIETHYHADLAKIFRVIFDSDRELKQSKASFSDIYRIVDTWDNMMDVDGESEVMKIKRFMVMVSSNLDPKFGAVVDVK